MPAAITRATGLVRKCLRALGLEDRVRRLYWRFAYARAVCEVHARGVRCRFLAINPYVAQAMKNLFHETEPLQEFIGSIRRGDTVWDVGAYMGLYTVFGAQASGPDGRVCAFEPDRKELDILQRNCRLNKAQNVTPFCVALTDRPGFVRPEPGAGEGMDVSEEKSDGASIPAETGDGMIASQRAPAPNVVKVDVEGAEWHVLAGMRRALADARCRFVLIEVHPEQLRRCGKSVEQVRALLDGCGLRVTGQLARGTQVHWYARRAPPLQSQEGCS